MTLYRQFFSVLFLVCFFLASPSGVPEGAMCTLNHAIIIFRFTLRIANLGLKIKYTCIHMTIKKHILAEETHCPLPHNPKGPFRVGPLVGS